MGTFENCVKQGYILFPFFSLPAMTDSVVGLRRVPAKVNLDLNDRTGTSSYPNINSENIPSQ